MSQTHYLTPIPSSLFLNSNYKIIFSNAIERIGKLIIGNLEFCGKANWLKRNGIASKLAMSFEWITINLLLQTCSYSPLQIQTDSATLKRQNLTGKFTLKKYLRTFMLFMTLV